MLHTRLSRSWRRLGGSLLVSLTIMSGLTQRSLPTVCSGRSGAGINARGLSNPVSCLHPLLRWNRTMKETCRAIHSSGLVAFSWLFEISGANVRLSGAALAARPLECVVGRRVVLVMRARANRKSLTVCSAEAAATCGLSKTKLCPFRYASQNRLGSPGLSRWAEAVRNATWQAQGRGATRFSISARFEVVARLL
jgi:hypothetical protein